MVRPAVQKHLPARLHEASLADGIATIVLPFEMPAARSLAGTGGVIPASARRPGYVPAASRQGRLRSPIVGQFEL